ncbi:MAG TPA: hypothetical protein VEU31_02575 [Candidatus Acidoferrales bacterium]|nr:hypothetical protein [Candidatus Acidoferrales bacterium]
MSGGIHFNTGGARKTESASPLRSASSQSGLRVAWQFIRRHWLKLLAISALLLTPCFWHPRIEAGDLGSHVYNAWLAQLIHQGKAPGLWIASQWNNVFFDFLLSGLGSLFGLPLAEKLAVSAAVLIFFWGAFALACAAVGRVPWFLLPCLAMTAYGWTYHAGFFNYYIALGLSFLALAVFWRGKRWERLLAVALAPLILLAHPLGVVWLLGAAAYIWIAESLPRRFHILLLLTSGAFLFLARLYLGRHYQTGDYVSPPGMLTGADQFILFGKRYFFVALTISVFAAAVFVMDVIRRRHEPGYWARLSIPLQLYAVAELGVILLPGSIYFPRYGSQIGLLLDRLSLVSAVLACCVLAGMRPRKWHLAGFAAIAAAFFSFVDRDEGRLNRMEERAGQLISTLPQGARVMETILAPGDWRVTFINHIVDRACIGRCFAYGNYEPASRQFRVRAKPGNGIVFASVPDVEAAEEGHYTVRPEDLPVYQVYQCSSTFTDLCVRKLGGGEKNDRLGVHPNH